MSIIVGMVNHIGIFVNNLKAMLDFYETVLGMKRHHHFTVEAKNIKDLFGVEYPAEVWVLEAENINIELIRLLKTESGKPEIVNGLHHIAFKIAQPEEIVNQARDLGLPVNRTFHKDHMVYFIKDLEGNSIEISEKKETDRSI